MHSLRAQEEAVCMNSMGQLPKQKSCREGTCWYLFHRSTASGHKVLWEMLNNWLPKCRQLALDCFFSYCIGCRIKNNIRWPLGESWEALTDHLTKPSVTAFFQKNSVFLQVFRKNLFELKKADIVQNLSPMFVKNIFSHFIQKVGHTRVHCFFLCPTDRNVITERYSNEAINREICKNIRGMSVFQEVRQFGKGQTCKRLIYL